MKVVRMFLMAVAMLAYCHFAFSQTGKLEGSVFDKEYTDALIGASVILEGTTYGAVTDIDGKYSITGIPAGTYQVRFSYIGYDSRLVDNVVIGAGATVELNMFLSMGGAMLEAVEIVDYVRTNTENAVLMEIKMANQIASGISAQQIGRSLDRDAGQVVRRVPGVSLMGNFINIRGLNPRYNSVLLHNATAPSLETDIKSFSFDMIPSGQIDRIIINKSPSADMTGDFAGGVVKLHLRSLPTENFYSVGYSTSIRTGTTFQDFYKGDHGGLFGLTVGSYHKLPDGFPDDVRKVGVDALISAGRSMKNDWVAKKSMAIPDQSFTFSMGHRMMGKRGLIGEITAINYSYSSAYQQVDRSDYNQYDFDDDKADPIYDFDDDLYTNNARIGIIHNWSFRLGKKTLIEFKNMANFTANSQYTFRQGQHYEFNYFPANHGFNQVFRGLYSGQLIGRHDVADDAGQVNWIAGFGNTYRKQPDYKRYRAERDPEDNSVQLFVPVGNAQPGFLGRFYSDMKEFVGTGGVSYAYKLGYKAGKNIIPTLTVGSYNEYKYRDFSARNIGFIRAPQFQLESLSMPVDELFAPENINNTTGVILDEQSNPSDNYSAYSLLAAIYSNIELPVNKFKIVAGLRYEYFLQRLNSATLTNDPVEVNRPNHFILPSVNISYNILSSMLVRVAYGMTYNNPEFREFAPFAFYDFNFNNTIVGQPNLVSSTIQNMEAKWEWYPATSDVINLSVFYKRFKNPIEVTTIPGQNSSGGSKSFWFRNAQYADVVGVEMEMKKTFANAGSSFFKNLGIMLNASYINSEVNLGKEALGESDKRPLQGQSPYLFNGGLFYHDKDRNYQINVMYNVNGPKIMFVGTDNYPDIYEMPRHLLDISASYLFRKNVELSFGVADVLNAEVIWLQDGNQNDKLERKNDQRIQSFKPGSVFTAGVKYNF
jgi:hypothetical protein